MLQGKYHSLSRDHTNLQADYSSLQGKYSQLDATYHKLKAEKESIQERYNQLDATCHKLKAEKESIQADYETLQEKYKELERILTPSPRRLPATVSAGNLNITIKDAQIADQIDGIRPIGKFIVITLELTNIGRVDEFIAIWHFLLLGSERLYWVDEIVYPGPSGFLAFIEPITAEATIERKIAFDVPLGEHLLYLIVIKQPRIREWAIAALGL